MKEYTTLEKLIEDHPKIKDFAKYYQSDKFEPIGFVIHVIPEAVLGKLNSNGNIHTIGLWVFDKVKIKNNQTNGVICQDFIEIEYEKTEVKQYTYYSGGYNSSGLKDKNHKSIRDFCERFGMNIDGTLGQYGCFKSKKNMTDKADKTTNHRYNVGDKALFPSELWILKLITDGFTKLKK